MPFLDHIRACNTHDMTGFRPFKAGDSTIGWVRHAFAEQLIRAGLDFRDDGGHTLRFADGIDDFQDRSAALDRAAEWMLAQGLVPILRHEPYPVITRWGGVPLARADRAIVVHFGFRAFGVHVNGLVRHGDGSKSLWIARRAANRAVAPGKLDNMVAGGQPFGLSLRQNIAKEAAEEAGIPAALAAQAVPVGAISYVKENTTGLKPDTMFIFDLEVPEDFEPQNTDGEVEGFMRWPVEQVLADVRDGQAWKFNVALVVIDFMIRHGHITADDEPDYVELIRGLRR